MSSDDQVGEAVVHQLPSDAAATVERLTRPDRPERGPGVHIVVHVQAEGGNRAWARVVAEGSAGDGVQRWIEHARRGASPGGWSEQHHPRAEVAVGEWKAAHAGPLDRLLIQHCKLAWELEASAPYAVEFPPLPLETFQSG